MLEEQSRAMSERISAFQTGNAARQPAAPVRQAGQAGQVGQAAKPAPQRAQAPAAKPAPKLNGSGRGPVGHMQASLATALKDDPDWKEF